MSALEAFPFPTDILSEEPVGSRRRHGSISKCGALSSPSVLSAAAECNTSLHTLACDDPYVSHIIPSIQSPPGATSALALFSPPETWNQHGVVASQEQHYFDAAFAAHVPTGLPTPPQEMSERLRLPSFHSLGIATPHPDSIELATSRLELKPLVGGSFPFGEDDIVSEVVKEQEDDGHCSTTSGLVLPPPTLPPPTFPLRPSILTPPDEPAIFDWNASSSARSSIPLQADQQHAHSTFQPESRGPASPSTTPASQATRSDRVPRITMAEAAEQYSVMEERDLETIAQSICESSISFRRTTRATNQQ